LLSNSIVEDALKAYKNAPIDRRKKRLSKDGYMSIRSVAAELLNRQDLANSPCFIIPTIEPKTTFYPNKFPAERFELWIAAYGQENRIIFISLGGGGIELSYTQRLWFVDQLLDYVKVKMQNREKERGYAFILHLKPTRDQMLLGDLKEILRLEARYPNLFILCGLMSLHEPYKHCTMMINHGGTGTIQKAASYGVPQLCVPIDSIDQVDNALMVQDAGLGLIQSFPPHRWFQEPPLRIDSFMKSVTELCDKQIYRNNAKAHASKQQGQQHNGLAAVIVILSKFYQKMRNIELER